ncbi:TatD family hydrolase [Micrococcus luteus]|uniref:TatD family hydrolase n=1 Tax=Micrococcus luteus TaxID=1270 RepID=UPI00398F9C2D
MSSWARRAEEPLALKVPPPLDTHAHVDASIAERDLHQLGAFLFAVTRSLDEFGLAQERRDARTLWGVGVHPGLVRANKAFAVEAFENAITSTALVGEVGLDGTSRVPIELQLHTFRSVLRVLQRHPRLVSVHSAGAHLRVLRELHRTPVDGVILHWWTASAELTEEAVRLGCYFSLPPAMMSSEEILRLIPRSRLLPETDHPYGDRRTRGIRRPGGVDEVERRLAAREGVERLEMRTQFWRNLARLTQRVGVMDHLGADWQAVLQSVLHD